MHRFCYNVMCTQSTLNNQLYANNIRFKRNKLNLNLKYTKLYTHCCLIRENNIWSERQTDT